MSLPLTVSALACGVLTCSIVACSASDKPGSSGRVGAENQEGEGFFETDGDPNAMGSTGGTNGFVNGDPNPPDEIDANDACAITQADAVLVEQPVDIIFMLDNSGSMDQELAAVESNINLNFARILIDSGVDYRVILLSRHRDGPRTPDDDETSPQDTSVCVTTPLSGLDACDTAEQPVFSERFFQFNTKVESDDSFDAALGTFYPPIASEYEEDDSDDMPLAPLGWQAWLRPGAKKVFLEVTDDNEDMSAAAFVAALVALPATPTAPAGTFGTVENPNFVFHSIVGVAEKATPTEAYLASEPVVAAVCTGNGGDVTTEGLVYQELSIMTGGLRFPLCQFSGFDVVFRRIAEDVVQTSNIACDFAIPTPPMGEVLDLAKVAVAYTPSNGGPEVRFGQTPALGVCQSNAFYIAEGRLNLCPDACSTIRNDPTASVDVLFTCEDTFLDPQ
jgi:hypothetical protein